MMKKILLFYFFSFYIYSFCGIYVEFFSNNKAKKEYLFPLVKEESNIKNTESRFFPFFYKFKNDNYSEKWYLYPFFRIYDSKNRHIFEFFPLLKYTSDNKSYKHFFLFPVFGFDITKKKKTNEENYYKKKFLFPLYYKKERGIGSYIFPVNSKVRLYFPFYYYYSQTQNRYFLAYLLNLFTVDEENGFKRYSLLYPIITFGKNKTQSFYRIFPLFIYQRNKDMRYYSFLYPFFITKNSSEVKSTMFFPFYMSYISKNRKFCYKYLFRFHDDIKKWYTKDFYFFPFWGHGKNFKKNTNIRYFLFPLGKIEEKKDFYLNTLRPLWKYQRTDNYCFQRYFFSFVRKFKSNNMSLFYITPLIKFLEYNNDNKEYIDYAIAPIFRYRDLRNGYSFKFLGLFFAKDMKSFDNCIGYYLRLFFLEKRYDKMKGDFLFHLIEWDRMKKEMDIRLNLIILRVGYKWKL